MHLGELENEQFFLDLWNATAFSRFIATLHARDNTASPPLRNISFHTFPYLSKKPLFKISHLLLAIFEAKIDMASAGRIDRQTRNPRRWRKRRKALTIGSLAGQIIERERRKTTHHRPVWNPLIPWCEKNLFHVSLSLGKAVTKHWTSNATVSVTPSVCNLPRLDRWASHRRIADTHTVPREIPCACPPVTWSNRGEGRRGGDLSGVAKRVHTEYTQHGCAQFSPIR